jgi:DNA mismatch repair protein MutS
VKAATTPLMKQYYSVKAKYPDALLLFRVGDFYETFEDDAVKTANALGIVLTKRANGSASFVSLAGFPYHALDNYLPKLVKAGYRVAICEQLEDPKMTKTIVKRGITEVVTPGIAFSDQVLENKTNNFLAGVHFEKDTFGMAFLDVSTGEFFIAQGDREYCEKLLQTFNPSEVIVRKSRREDFFTLFGEKFYTYTFEDWVFTHDFGYEKLTRQFQTTTLKGFGIESLDEGIIAAGAALHYLSETHHDKTGHISRISRIEQDDFVWMDQFTIRNLELVSSPHLNAVTLIRVLDKTSTPMGGRMMKRWILLPLLDIKRIEDRQSVVSFFIANDEISEQITEELKAIGDIERLISKVTVQKINPRELLHLSTALAHIADIKKLMQSSCNTILKAWSDQIDPCSLIRDRIQKELKPDPPAVAIKGGIINKGVSQELDDLRSIAYEGKDYLTSIQQREILKTGITSLKIGFNNVFGYYLEVTHAHKNKVPEDWIRKQTLTNAERYITPELKEYEEKILGAEEKILALELQLFQNLIVATAEYVRPVQQTASVLARMDCLLSFAKVAKERSYCMPVFNEGYALKISAGRHPVIEQQMPPGQEYVPNDIYLDNNTQQIIILTGPNMSGKSALLRQTALISLMAQIGSYVPAAEAQLSIVDKIFTRVGASDNISSGESTFMVEMNETASILNNISNRSLVLLDEIGRGTSTYDGISIAWAITEYLHEHPLSKAKTLFATHYHELNELASYLPRCKNFHVSVKESGNKVIFLHKLEPGGTEHSFGIHVARMAGIPHLVINRADEVLAELEKKINTNEVLPASKSQAAGFQLSFVQLDDPLLLQIKNELLNLDINSLTPVEALMKLNSIKNMLVKKKEKK